MIWYKQSEQTKLYFNMYISISNIEFLLSHGNELEVRYYDYTKPTDIWNTERISHNDALYLEGMWCEDNEIHSKLLELCMINIPKKEYIFKGYDWAKYPKQKKKGQTENDIIKLMECYTSIVAKTEGEAYQKLKDVQKESKIQFQLEIVDIKEIN